MTESQEVLKKELVRQTQKLIARGGPAALTLAGKPILPDEPVEAWCDEATDVPHRERETYYPTVGRH
jgi:hypothetical protein